MVREILNENEKARGEILTHFIKIAKVNRLCYCVLFIKIAKNHFIKITKNRIVIIVHFIKIAKVNRIK